MRILYVITRAQRGGAQSHLHSLVVAAAERGEVLVAVGEDGPFCEGLRKSGISYCILKHLKHAPSLSHDSLGVVELIKLIRRFRPDLVHAHSGKAGLLARMAAALCRVPAVYTAHGFAFGAGASLGRMATSLAGEWLAARTGACTIAVSRSECRLSHRYRISAPTGTVVIHNGTDAPRYRAVPELSPPVVIMVARFAPPKQQELLIRAFRRTSGNARLWLVGDGPGLDRAQARAWGSGKADRILFWGDRADVPELLAQAQIAALISANEGFGLSLIEAMSLGMPVIASDAGAMGEIVAHRNTGLLVPPGDEAQLAAALEKLIADPIERKRMGCAGLARYRAKFSVDRMLAQTFGVYEAVCGSAEIRKPDVCSRCRYPAPCVPTAEALGD